jgi:hypothetical protein
MKLRQLGEGCFVVADRVFKPSLRLSGVPRAQGSGSITEGHVPQDCSGSAGQVTTANAALLQVHGGRVVHLNLETLGHGTDGTASVLLLRKGSLMTARCQEVRRGRRTRH